MAVKIAPQKAMTSKKSKNCVVKHKDLLDQYSMFPEIMEHGLSITLKNALDSLSRENPQDFSYLKNEETTGGR